MQTAGKLSEGHLAQLSETFTQETHYRIQVQRR